MKKIFENVKGTYDYLPEKQIIRENIKNVLKPIFIKYGFLPIETPIICSYDLLASKYSEGADILNETYKLSDQGKRKLGLRYDLTITFSKLISSNPSISLPFKRFEIGRVYRDGPIKTGRNREFTQCDVDVVGIDSMMAEAEYMAMINEAYKKLGLDIEIEFNNRKLLTGLIYKCFGDISEEILRSSIMLIDKFAKLSEEDIIKEFENIGISKDKFDYLKKYLKMTYNELKKELDSENINFINEGLSEIEELYKYLNGTEACGIMKLAPYLARGIDIYTGMVWEVFLKDKKIADQNFNLSIGGGGRFDNIITSFIDDGNKYPAVGMSFGLDVIFEVLNIKNENAKTSVIDLYIIPMETKYETFKFATKLRQCGVNVEIEKEDKKLKKSMMHVNREGIPYVIIIGTDELTNNMVKLKNMESGKEENFKMVDIELIAKFIKERK